MNLLRIWYSKKSRLSAVFADILFKLSEMDSDIKIKGYDKEHVFENFLLTL